MNLHPLWLSLELAALTTVILLGLGVVIAYGVHFFQFPGRGILRMTISLPLVLPPTVLGYYLLIAFQPEGIFGSFVTGTLHIPLAFSFGGLLLGSVIFSLPFMLGPVFSALKQVPQHYIDLAYTMGKSKWVTYWKVSLPMIRPAIWSGAAMSFAHTMGEFGVVWMIGGSIPGETKVASIELFELVESMQYEAAQQYAWILLGISVIILFLVQWLEGKIGS
ncbi:MAG: molybdate ABC transporter permease subunit [Bacteroidota bacterium]